MRTILTVTALAAGLASGVKAEDPGLWTVQATDTGSEVVCDAFGRGMHDRPLYEFRFRRSKTNILFIVAYDGPRIASEEGDVEITVDGQSHVLPGVATRFGDRNAFMTSINPKSINFHDFDRTIPIAATFGGSRFELAFYNGDRLGDGMDQCMKFAKIAG